MAAKTGTRRLLATNATNTTTTTTTPAKTTAAYSTMLTDATLKTTHNF